MRSFGRRFLAGILTAILVISLFAGHVAEAGFLTGMSGKDLVSGTEGMASAQESPAASGADTGPGPRDAEEGLNAALYGEDPAVTLANAGTVSADAGTDPAADPRNREEGPSSAADDGEGRPSFGAEAPDKEESAVPAAEAGKPADAPGQAAEAGKPADDPGQAAEAGKPADDPGQAAGPPESGDTLREGQETGAPEAETADSPEDPSAASADGGEEASDIQPLNESAPLTRSEREDICREIAALCREQDAQEALFFEEPLETISAEAFVGKLAGQDRAELPNVGGVTWIRTAGYDTTVGVNGQVGYNGWGTHAFLVKDSQGGENKTFPAICMSPNLSAPADGRTYTTDTADIFTSEDPTLLKILYYGFGGPGKDWAEQVYCDNHGVRSKDASLILTHTAVSKAFRELFRERYQETGSQWDYCLAGTTYVKDTEDFLERLKALSDPPAGTYAQILWIRGRTQFLVYLKRGALKGRLAVHKYAKDTQLFGDGDYDLAATFEVINADTREKVKTIKTDKNGDSKAVTLPAGTYYLKETQAGKNMILPQFHYTASDNITILNEDVTAEVGNDAYKHCRVAIEKVTEFGKLLTDASGVEFTLSVWNGSRYVEREKLRYDGELKRFCSGVIYADGTNPTGRFKVEETKLPTNFDYLPEGQEPFLAYGTVEEARWSAAARKEKGKTWGYVWLKTVENRHEYTVQLRKVDKKTGRPVPGATFVLYAVVKESGRLQRLGVMKYDAAAQAGGKTGLYVYGKDSREAGEQPVLITEKNGGAFRVVETAAPENYGGEYERDFTLTEKTPVDKPYLINPDDDAKNTPDPPYGVITVMKKDAAGRPLTGAKFLVREYDRKKEEYTRGTFQYFTRSAQGAFQAHTAGTYYLTDNGDGSYTSEYLPILAGENAIAAYGRNNGGRYKVMEVSPPEGYVNTQDPHSANAAQRWFKEVRFDTTLPSNAVDRQSAVFTAVNPENEIPLKKVAADGETPLKAEFTIWPDSPGLAGKTFVGRTGEEDAELRLSAEGTPVWTGDDGLLTFARLPVGRYVIKETNVSSPWYEPLDTSFAYTVSDDGSIDGKLSADLTIVRNEPSRPMEITKTDTVPDEGDVWTAFPEGTVFHVYSSVEGSDVYRTVPYAKIVWRDGAFVSEKTGRTVKLRWKESNRGKFKVAETASTPGYIRDTEERFVEIPEVPEEDADSTIRLSFENEPNHITIRKEDEQGNRLSGAVFSVRRKEDGTESGADDRTLVTDENGEASTWRLRPGIWTYEETAAPEGYHLDPAARGEFVVDEDGNVEGETCVFTVVNYREVEVVLKKQDAATGAELDPQSGFPSGTVFDVYEWDEELEDYKSAPVMNIVYKDDYRRSAAGRGYGKEEGTENESDPEPLSGIRETEGNAGPGGPGQAVSAVRPGSVEYWSDPETAAVFGGEPSVFEEEADGEMHAGAVLAGAGTYTVRYELRGGAWPVSAEAPPTVVGIAQEFGVPVPKQNGKVFMGWKIDGLTEGQLHEYGQYSDTHYQWANSTTADGISQTGATIFRRLAEAGGQVVFSARWADPKPYHIVYDLNGGSWVSGYEPQTEVYNGFGREGSTYSSVFYARSQRLVPPDGYAYDGWRVTGLTDTTHSKFAKGEEWSGAADVARTGAQKFCNLNHQGGTVTITALWKPVGYHVSYDYQGGYGSESDPENVSLGETFEVAVPTREGYDFTGWDIQGMSAAASWTWWDAKGQATSGTGTQSLSRIPGTAFRDLRTDAQETVRFKANWERYSVTYRLQGGSWPAGAAAPVTYTASASLAVPVPRRVGYLFAGWEEAGTSDVVLGNGRTGDVVLTALWRTEGIWVNAEDGGAPVAARSKSNRGRFKVVERTATQGYIRDKDPQYFEIEEEPEDGSRVELTFVNEPNEYRVHKIDPDGLRINGAVFRFYSEDAVTSAPHITGEHTTGPYEGEEGVIVLRRIPTGTWHFREVSVPSPYVANTTAEYTFVINGDGEVESSRNYQEVPNGSGPSVCIRKVSEEGKPLSGAWFEITREADGRILEKKSNSSGTVLLSGLSDGDYAIRESRTRNDGLKALGFVLSEETWRVRVQGSRLTALSEGVTVGNEGGADVAVITAVNRRPKLTILKKDTGGSPLSGAVFLLTNTTTGETKTGTTGSDGTILFKEAFSDGAWTAVETKTPDGPLVYRPDNHTETFDVENGLFGGMFETLSLPFTNEPYSFEIRKANTEGNPLPGVRFHVWSDDGFDREVETALLENPDGSPRFDENGLRVASAMVEGLSSGRYYVEETWTPDGYRPDPQTKEVLVTSDGPSPASLLFVNEPLVLKLRKTDEEGRPLAGASFRLRYLGTESEPKDETVAERVSGPDGYLRFPLPGLRRGGYELRETEAPEDYEVLPSGIPFSYDGRTVTVDTSGLSAVSYEENTWTVTAGNSRKRRGVVLVKKVDLVSGEVLRDGRFEARERTGLDAGGRNLYAATGQELIWSEEEQGFVSEPPLVITKENGGCYDIVEVRAPDGYIRDFEEEVVLREGTDAPKIVLTAPNTPNSFEIWKEDEQGERLDAWFSVWPEDGGTEAEAEAAQTTGGVLRLEKLASGTWHFREVPPYPEGCKGDDSLHTFVVDEDGRVRGDDHVVVVNQRVTSKYGIIEINKTDEDRTPMEGVVIRAYPFDAEVGPNGVFRERLWLLEHREETGLTDAEIDALLAETGSYEFAWDAEKQTYRTLQLLPLDEKNRYRYLVAEEGFENSPAGLANEGCAANVREEVCLDPAVNPRVTATEFPTLRLQLLTAETDFVNSPNVVRILKVDEEGDPLGGAVFRITCDQGHEAFPETDLTTGGDGWTPALQKLPAGTYAVQEIAAPQGYLLHAGLVWHFAVNDRGLIAETAADGAVLDKDGDGETVDEYAGSLSLQIVDEKNGVCVLKTDADGEPVADVEITFWNPRGQLYAVKTTGPDGRTEPLPGLAEGVWTYKETKKNGVPYTDVERHFLVSPLGVREKYGDTPVRELILKIKNGEKSGNVTVEKVDEKTRERLHGAVFKVFPYDPALSDYDRENPVLTLTEETGQGGEPAGIYRNETPIPADSVNGGRFLVAETAGPLDPETGERVYAAVWEKEIDVFEQEDWEFTLGSGDPAENRRTSYRIEKVDEEDRLLDGAVFRIWAEGEEAKAVEKTTGGDGETGAILLGGLDPANATPLSAGKTYCFKEMSPPPGAFALDGAVHRFTVAEDGTILGATSRRVKVINHPRSARLFAGGEGRLPGLLAAFLGLLMLILSVSLRMWADARDGRG